MKAASQTLQRFDAARGTWAIADPTALSSGTDVHHVGRSVLPT
jgi:hypothetical protein